MRKIFKTWEIPTLCSWFLLLIFISGQTFGDSVTTKTYRALTSIQEQIAGSEGIEPDLDGGIDRLKELLDTVSEGSLDEALTLQTLGYAVMSNEEFKPAIGYLRRSLDTNKLPQNVVFNVGYIVAQLYAALGDFSEALAFAKDWFANLENPSSDQFMFMANIYAQEKRYEESIGYALEAIDATESPKETWYQLLTANYFALEDFQQAASTLRIMIDLWPNEITYWEQLASVDMLEGKLENALASLRVAFEVGLIQKESTIKSLVQLSIRQGVPENSARVLERSLKTGLVPEEKEYYDLMAHAWREAREYENAIVAHETSASLSETGEPFVRIADIHMKFNRWSEAEEALEKALDYDLSDEGKAWLLLGITQSELLNFDAARTSLRKARAQKSTSKSAQKWLRYSEDMRRQADWIAENS